MLRHTRNPSPTRPDSTSPSSADALDLNPPHPSHPNKRRLDPASEPTQPSAKREKREQNSSRDSPDVASDPKNGDALPSATFVNMVHEAAKAAWDLLSRREDGQQDLRQKDIIAAAVASWSELDHSEKVIAKLKKELYRYFKKGAMFKRSDRPDAPSDAYVMVNPSFIAQPFKSPRAKEVGKRGDMRKGLVQITHDAEDEVLFEGVVSRSAPTVPDEWTAEAYKPVRLSTFDKSNGITFVGDEKDNRVKGFKGFRMIRATSGVSEGDWYYECEIMPCEKGHCRLGWTSRRSDVETPVGFDAYGFGLRDLTGDFVHRARPKEYGKPFGPGDVIGCRIVMPALSEVQRKAVEDAEKRWLDFRFVSLGQGQQPPDSGVDLSPEGRVEFFRNGESMGIPDFFTKPQPIPPNKGEGNNEKTSSHDNAKGKTAGKDTVEADNRKVMKGAVYYPSVALFEDAVLKVNFGPEFKFPLPEGSQPMCAAAREAPPPPPPEEQVQPSAEKELNKDQETVVASGLPEKRELNTETGSKEGGGLVDKVTQSAVAVQNDSEKEVTAMNSVQTSLGEAPGLNAAAALESAPVSDSAQNAKQNANPTIQVERKTSEAELKTPNEERQHE